IAILTHIRGIAIGNEVLGGADQSLWEVLLGAAKNIHNATKTLKIDDVIQITTAHSMAVFNNSYPPSSCTFNDNIIQYMKPFLEFFSNNGAPFCLNAYPFLAYMDNPNDIDINYARFQTTDGIYDEKTKLHYDNMLDAITDAAYTALENAEFRKMEVIVTETGWASHCDQNEAAANGTNAKIYNYNLRKRLAKRKGTPLRPKKDELGNAEKTVKGLEMMKEELKAEISASKLIESEAKQKLLEVSKKGWKKKKNSEKQKENNRIGVAVGNDGCFCCFRPLVIIKPSYDFLLFSGDINLFVNLEGEIDLLIFAIVVLAAD
ncbi:glucan endo-1,3-beta-glucosidase 14-like, partial [Impatiens glandulifera]|uniref:glucan endo-1,3-beta-glucosidase 14-like n=1 Tax=Impatiens glandulifera TaxID=253017 RepID=UPI001FB0A212